MNFQNAVFLTTAVSPDVELPDLPMVIMAGRSNSGKSSLINMLTGRKNLAHVGQCPGKTVNINLYVLDNQLILCDLPGYGYAKRSFAERDRWAALISGFLNRASKRLRPSVGILVTDGRIDVQESDRTMADYFTDYGLQYITALNKTEKLKASQSEKTYRMFGKVFDRPIFTSGVTGMGADKLREMLEAFVSECASLTCSEQT